MGVFHDLFGQGHVILIGMMAAVDHYGSKPAVDAALAQFKGIPMIQVQADGQVCLDDGGFHQLEQVGMVGIFPGAAGDLRIRGAFCSLAASVIPWMISMLFTLKAPMA